LDYDNTISMDITLTPAVTLIGRVTDLQGRPIAGADVNPSVHTGWPYGGSFGLTVFKRTDGNGRYEIKALPVGQKYHIGVGLVDGYGENAVKLGLLEQPGRIELEDIVLLQANLSVSGIVFDESDTPVPQRRRRSRRRRSATPGG